MIDQREELIKLANSKMPFGKYKDSFLLDLPEAYLVWFRQKGFPKGKLGDQLALCLELRINGLTEMVRKFKK